MYSAWYVAVYVVLLPNNDRRLWWPLEKLLRLIIPFLHTQWYGYECLSDQWLSIKRTLESMRLYLLCAQTGVFILWSLGRDVRLVGNTRLCHCSDWVIYLGGAICRKWIRYYIGNSGDLWDFCVIYKNKQQSLVLCNQKFCLKVTLLWDVMQRRIIME